MATADLTKSIPAVLEELVLAKGTAGLALTGAQVAVKGVYVVSFVVDLASQAANTSSVQEFSLTTSASAVRVAVGDLFVPFATVTLNAGLSLAPAAARTIDKVPVYTVNSTVGALDAASATYTALWLKVA